MNSLKFFPVIERRLVKFFLIIFLGFNSAYSSYSNPIADPPVILEIHFGTGGYSIELLIPDYWDVTNLDNMRMVGLYDTAQFIAGIEFIPGEVFFVTQEDFSTSFYINQSGDDLHLEYWWDSHWALIDFYGLQFGIYPVPNASMVSAPVGEESIAWQMFSIYDPPYSQTFWWTVKELPATIGSSPFQVSKRAGFSGYVKDKNDEPLEGVKLYYCQEAFHYATYPTVPELISDQNGYFATDSMFCRKYIIWFQYDEGSIGDTTLFIEPDSANYFEFKLDTLLTGIYEIEPSILQYSIFNYPNPSLTRTTFIIESNNPKPDQKGVIKIYNEAGYIVDILPVEILENKQEINYNFSDKSLPSGLYIYNLEIRNRKVASGKMIVTQ
jgi:hypothetical protein